MNFDMTVILALVSFTAGLLAGVTLARPRYRHYPGRYMYDRHDIL